MKTWAWPLGQFLRSAAWTAIGVLAVVAAPTATAAASCPEGAVESIRAAPALAGDVSSEQLKDVVSATCKIWPHDPDKLLVAVAFSVGDSDPGSRKLQTRVAMLDARDQHVLAGYASQDQEDAGFQLSDLSLSLDTARYDLAPGVRAFGVVIDNVADGPSCPDYRYDRQLSLFVVEGAELKPVLRQYLHAWTRVEGEPCALSRARLVTDSADIVLAMADASHESYRDIQLRARITRDVEDPNDADARSGERIEQEMLRYDGQQYRPVGDGSKFWLWLEPLDAAE